jgi:C_GCAxxG_C_C family probable redox protein
MLFASELLGEDPDIIDVARYLGGGVGRSGDLCGAVTGAALALGVRDRHDPGTWADHQADGYVQLQGLICDFRGRFGATTCRALTECDMSNARGLERFRDEGVRQSHCMGYVGWMCGRLATILRERT